MHQAIHQAIQITQESLPKPFGGKGVLQHDADVDEMHHQIRDDLIGCEKG